MGRRVALLVLLVCLGMPAPSAAPAGRWREEKCRRYSRDWSAALAHFGPAGLGRAFLASHDAFLRSDCTGPHDVCARSAEELRLANAMVVLSMNAGMASTFAPFGCR